MTHIKTPESSESLSKCHLTIFLSLRIFTIFFLQNQKFLKISYFTFLTISPQLSKIQKWLIWQINPWNLRNMSSRYPMAPIGPEVGTKRPVTSYIFQASTSMLKISHFFEKKNTFKAWQPNGPPWPTLRPTQNQFFGY